MKKKTLAVLLAVAASAMAQTPGTIGVFDSSGTHYVGFTSPPVLLQSVTWTLPTADSAGCLYSNGSHVMSFIGCSPSGGLGEIQFSKITSVGSSTGLIWDDTAKKLDITGVTLTPALFVHTGFVQSAGGFLSTVDNWQAFNSETDGALLRGYHVASNSANTKGGYVAFSPVLYNPNGGSQCLDIWGNIVTQPTPLTGLSAFGAHDTIMWVSTSPSMPASGCGTALPVELDYGLNINSYFFARGGLATDLAAFNSIHSLNGGVTAVSFTAGHLYPAGTVTNCCGTLSQPAYLGGYIQIGHSDGPPAAGTIATTNNPLTQYDGVNQGTMYWDDVLACVNVYNGSSWSCLGSGGGGGSGTPAGNNTQLQFNSSGNFGASADLTWTSSQLTVVGTVSSTIGFITTNSSSTDAIQAPNAGITGKWLIAKDSLFIMEEAVPALSGSGQARIYADSTKHKLYVSANSLPYFQVAQAAGTLTAGNCVSIDAGGSFVDAGGPCSTGGGGGTVSSAGAKQVSYYPAAGTTVTGSSNFTFDSSTQLLTVVASSSSTAGIAVSSGFIQSDAGFLAQTATAVNYNAIQAPGGGMAAKSFTATNYLQAGHNNSRPGVGGNPLTTNDTLHQGAIFWNDSNSCMEVYNGSSWSCLGSGGGGGSGVSSLNGLSGALSILGSNITVTPSGSSVTVSLPQAVGTTSAVTFGTVTSSGVVGSTMAASSSCAWITLPSFPYTSCITSAGQIIGTSFSIINGGTTTNVISNAGYFTGPGSRISGAGMYEMVPASSGQLSYKVTDGVFGTTLFSVNGAGDIYSAGSINLVGGSGAGAPLKINGSNVIAADRSANFTTVNATVGLFGSNLISPITSIIVVGSAGSLVLRTSTSSPVCSGVSDGFIVYDTATDVLYVCSGGVAKAH